MELRRAKFTREEIGFNPTLVRLRSLRAFRGAGHPEEFQSHAGSIEVARSAAHKPGTPWFQSHAGSIEVFAVVIFIAYEKRFQSHAGSIEVRKREREV